MRLIDYVRLCVCWMVSAQCHWTYEWAEQPLQIVCPIKSLHTPEEEYTLEKILLSMMFTESCWVSIRAGGF